MRKISIGSLIAGIIIGAIMFGGVFAVAAGVTASPSTWKFFVDGAPRNIEAYSIDGSNYLKLRDVFEIADVGVWYDGDKKEVYIERDKGYDPDYAGGTSATPSQEIQPGQGKQIYEDSNFRLTYAGTRISPNFFREEEIQFFVENYSSATLTFQADSMSINGQSLGYISGSDSIAPKSSGYVRFSAEEEFPTMTPDTISGKINVIDFDRILTSGQAGHRIAEITFINESVR